MIRHFLTSLFLLLSFSAQAVESVFKLTLSSEPSLWDPQLQKSANSSQLLQQLHRSLFRYETAKGLIPDLASHCEQQKLKLTCTISDSAKWHDGTSIEAQHFLNTFLYLLNPKNKAPKADFLFVIKNAKSIYLGKMAPEKLGFKIQKPQVFEIQFESEVPEFEYTLTSSLLSPRKNLSPESPLQFFSGPYRLGTKSNQKIQLLSNQYYLRGSPHRPTVEFLVVEEETVALKLFQRKQIDFLRRLPTLYIPQYKNKKEFHWIPLARMDYFGFGPELDSKLELRKSLTHSLNYIELQQIFHSEGRPGCFGLSPSLYSVSADFDGCYKFESSTNETKKYSSEKPLTLIYSAAGGDDHKRATDWLQNQWKKNLGIQITPKGIENKIYLEVVRSQKPALFRRGVNLDRPTCLAALEAFIDSPQNDNPLKIKNIQLTKTFEKLRTAKTTTDKKSACTEALKILQAEYQLIPTGPIHFAILSHTHWVGWNLNELNQLDLAELKQVKP